jgi:hypothetical protein
MNGRDENAKVGPAGAEGLEAESELTEVLGNFKASVDAWSEAMMSRPREVKAPAHINWNSVTKWALGCAVFIGTVSGGVYQNYHQQEVAKAQAARIAEQHRQLIAEREQQQQDSAAKEEDLMAKVDRDISREVPSALEPLASLMEDNGNTGN